MNDRPLFGKENSILGTLEEKDSVLSAASDTHQLIQRMLAATSVRVDDTFFLVTWLHPLWGPGLVPASTDGRCYRSERGGRFPPFVHGSVASSPGLRALILQSQGERKLSEWGIAIEKCDAQGRGICSVLFSILHSVESHGME